MEHTWYTVKDIENQIEEVQIPIGTPPKSDVNQPKQQTYLPIKPLMNWIIKKVNHQKLY
jgi:hypothetical protein